MTANKWISETKKYATKTNKSFKESLQDKNHQVSYHANKSDQTWKTPSGINEQLTTNQYVINNRQGKVINYFFNGNGKRIFIHKK